MRYPEITKVLAGRIRQGEYAAGAALPSETALAVELGVARGTVRRALEEIQASGASVARAGNRWVIQDPRRTRAYDFARSLTEWASAAGLEQSGETIEVARGRATPTEAQELGTRPGSGVVRVVRLVQLDHRPALVVRATFAGWLADVVAGLPPDVRSVLQVVLDSAGVSAGPSSHRLSAVSANSTDSRLLGVYRAAPLVHVLRTARTADGRGLEYADLRFRPDAVTLLVPG